MDTILQLSCPDQTGIVLRVTKFIYDMQCNIRHAEQYLDPIHQQFFLRIHFESTAIASNKLATLQLKFQPLADQLKARWKMVDPSIKMRTLILVSKAGHCLNDLLYRTKHQRLPIDIVGIAANHQDLAPMVEHTSIPFFHLPLANDSDNRKTKQEHELMKIIKKNRVELIILARYMQILSPDFCEQFSGRMINIHHSFLPGFKGAKPYHQAYERGVKLIGATAHYVTNELDEGPIIEQDVTRVSHSKSPVELAQLGQDIETKVLAKAVKWHAEHRIMINHSRTIIFDH